MITEDRVAHQLSQYWYGIVKSVPCGMGDFVGSIWSYKKMVGFLCEVNKFNTLSW